MLFNYYPFIKTLLQPLFSNLQSSCPNGEHPSIAIISLGSHARGDLTPESDLDLLFVVESYHSIEDIQKRITTYILDPLWKDKHKVSYSTRNIHECLEEAQRDDATFHSFLETQFICGSQALYRKFEQAINKLCQSIDTKSYIQERLATESQRHQKHGNTPFLQEPNIKQGVGGLRDYQNIIWMGRVCLRTKTLDDIARKKCLLPNEIKQLKDSYQFLLKVRNALHSHKGHPGDILNLETQPTIAEHLGFKQENLFERIEAFMKIYYGHAQNIFHISSWFKKRIANTRVSKRRKFYLKLKAASKKGTDGFVLIDGQIYHKQKNIFKKDPCRLIRLFKHSQENNAQISFELSGLIQNIVPTLDEFFIYNPTVNESFWDILENVGHVYPVLKKMHACGVLGKLIPEFGALTCLVQHEHYHRYTADIHTLKTIKELDTIFQKEGPYIEPYLDAIESIRQPELLYLILLLHDIGKAGGIPNHDKRGALLAKPVLDRFKIAESTQNDILFIIENHLKMSQYWQKYDIDDPEVIARFGSWIGNKQRLHLLYIHTFCDACGTSETLWNSHKNSLHHQLYKNTLAYLRNPEGKPALMKEMHQRKKSMLSLLLNEKTPHLSQKEIEKHCHNLADRYFIRYPKETIINHINMIHVLQEKGDECLLPISYWIWDTNKTQAEIHIVAKDRPGLFYILTSSLSACGLDIISTRAWTREDGIAIDKFKATLHQEDITKAPSLNKKFEQYFKKLIENEHALDKTLIQENKRHRNIFIERKRTPYKLSIKRKVKLEPDPSNSYLILEIQTSDEPALLSRLTKVIYLHQFEILFARITTEEGVARDTFHLKIKDPNDCNALVKEIKNILT